ncbi:hypothetical protein [Eubacterium callanderi]|uniref:hypothetical protein n=1 Tax=Eubacterium callanderi TaxID=53442 RepID=UPI00391CECF1
MQAFYSLFRNADHGARLFCDGYFFMERIAPKIAFKMVTPGEDKALASRAAVTDCLM